MEIVGNRFELVRELGDGGSGVVWRALDTHLRREVAVKLLRPEATANPAAFVREAEMTARLEHDHIVRLYDFGMDERYGNYLVLELVRGRSFNRILPELQDMPIEQRLMRVALTALNVADGLTGAHRLRIVHRDVKPENILVAGEGAPSRAKLSDFGIAAMAGEAGTRSWTFGYASPEQLSHEPLGTATDVYSLGVTIYTALMGALPYSESTPYSQVAAIAEGRRRPFGADMRIRGQNICEIVDQMLLVSPEDRPSIHVVASALRRQLASDPSTVDAVLAVPAPRPIARTTNPADSAALASTGISAIYESRDRFTSEHPMDRVLQSTANGETVVVGRSLRNVLGWDGAIRQALQNGTTIRMCLLHPDAADMYGSPASRLEILASLATFRSAVHPHIKRTAPPGRLLLSFHRLPGTDSFLRARNSETTFAAWQITAARNRAQKRTLVIDCEVGVGRDIAERYEAICGDAEQSALAYSYDRGTLLDKLPG